MTAQPAPSSSPDRASLSLVPAWTYDVIDSGAHATARRDRWTSEQIVAAMRSWTECNGRPPRSYEWAPATGRASGLLPAGPARWELEYPRWPSTGTAADRFGSWCNALRAAGLPARIPQHDLPLPERILAARRLAVDGHALGAIADTLGVAKSTVHGYLNGSDCPDCGGPLVRGAACRSCIPRRRPSWMRDDVLAALRRWHVRFGRAPASGEWGWTAGPRSTWVAEFPRWPSAANAQTHFGSWNAAIAAAGIAPRRRPTWTHDDIVAALQTWATNHGRPPGYADFRRETDRSRWPDPKTVAARFGSWRAALEASTLS